MKKLLNEINICTICKAYMPSEPNAILSAQKKSSKIVLLSRATGRIAQKKGNA